MEVIEEHAHRAHILLAEVPFDGVLADQGWCFHLKEKKACFMAMPDWNLQQECEDGNIPHLHYVLYH